MILAILLKPQLDIDVGDYLISVINIFLFAGYDVCTPIGRATKSQIYLIGKINHVHQMELSLPYEAYIVFSPGETDESKPQKGVIVKMFSSKCSTSIFVICDPNIVQVSIFFQI
jgi:hypothetical protein